MINYVMIIFGPAWLFLFLCRANKKLWKEKERWLHDCYDERDQAPKSREELIAIYGYDIRSKDGPPEEGPQVYSRGRGGGRGRGR